MYVHAITGLYKLCSIPYLWYDVVCTWFFWVSSNKSMLLFTSLNMKCYTYLHINILYITCVLMCVCVHACMFMCVHAHIYVSICICTSATAFWFELRLLTVLVSYNTAPTCMGEHHKHKILPWQACLTKVLQVYVN